ncbi:MAG: hypothetical protein JNJ99_00660 [Crocinitomicaceae bacterium]|nr:hypothetical protein [Crocinitomicaceae bacterium]
MKLSEFRNHLSKLSNIRFELENGELVPQHFHVTEVGQINKKFIDCGGTLRDEIKINFQLWQAEDYDHRLSAEKLNNIIQLSIEKLNLADAEIEVEYQRETIGKYALSFKDDKFILMNTLTDCLAQDKCGIPVQKQKIRLSELNAGSGSCCTPGSKCC